MYKTFSPDVNWARTVAFCLISPIVTGTGFSNALLSSGSKYFYKSYKILPFVTLYYLYYVSWVFRMMPEAAVAFAIVVVIGWMF